MYKPKESFRTKTKTLNQQIQILKKSFPLLKISFEKLELELSEIHLQLSKEVEKSPKRNLSPVTKFHQFHYVANRSGSLAKQLSSLQEPLHRVQHLVMSMAKFKQDFLKRDNLIVALVKTMTENNLEAQILSDSAERYGSDNKICKELLPSYGVEDEGILQERVKELQKFNNNLLDELEAARSQLVETKMKEMEKKKFEKKEENGYLTKTTTFSNYRRYSQNKGSEWKVEKAKLNARIEVLTNELNRIVQINNERLVEMRSECDKQTSFCLFRLVEANKCIGDFLESMENLQTGALKQDEFTIRKFQEDFNAQKAQLVDLYKELKSFISMMSNGMNHAGNISDTDTYRSLREKDMETTIRYNVAFKSQSAERLNKPKDYSHHTKDYSVSQKIKFMDFNMSLNKEQTRTFNYSAYESNQELLHKLISSLKVMEDQTIENLTMMNYKILIQSKQLGRLQALLKEKAQQLPLELQSTCKFCEKNKEGYRTRSSKILELEKRIIHIKRSMEEEQEVLEKENVRLKKRIAEMETEQMHNTTKLLIKTSGKNQVIKINKDKTTNLSKDLKAANNYIQYLKDKLARSSLVKVSLRTYFIELLNSLLLTFKQRMQNKLTNIDKKLNVLITFNIPDILQKLLKQKYTKFDLKNSNINLIKNIILNIEQLYSRKHNALLSTIENKSSIILNALKSKVALLCNLHAKGKSSQEVSRLNKKIHEKEAIIKELRENIVQLKTKSENEIKCLNAKLSEKDILVQEASKIIENTKNYSSDNPKNLQSDVKSEIEKKQNKHNEDVEKQIKKLRSDLLSKEKALQDMRKFVMDYTNQHNDIQLQYKRIMETNNSLISELNEKKKKISEFANLLKKGINNIIVKIRKDFLDIMELKQDKLLVLTNRLTKFSSIYLNKRKVSSTEFTINLIHDKVENTLSKTWRYIKDKLVQNEKTLNSLKGVVSKLKTKQYTIIKSATISREERKNIPIQYSNVIDYIQETYVKISEHEIKLQRKVSCSIVEHETTLNALFETINHLKKHLRNYQRKAKTSASSLHRFKELLYICLKVTNESIENALLKSSEAALKLRTQFNKLAVENKVIHSKVVQLNKELKDKNQLVNSLKKQIQDNDSMIAIIQEQAERKNNEINDLRIDLENKNNRTAEVNGNDRQKEEFKGMIKVIKQKVSSFIEGHKKKQELMKNRIAMQATEYETKLKNIHNKLKTVYNKLTKYNTLKSKKQIKHFSKLIERSILLYDKEINEKILEYNEVIEDINLKFNYFMENKKNNSTKTPTFNTRKHITFNIENYNETLTDAIQQAKFKVNTLNEQSENFQSEFFIELKKKIEMQYSVLDSLGDKLATLKQSYAIRINKSEEETIRLRKRIGEIIKGLQEKVITIQYKDEEIKNYKTKVGQLNSKLITFKKQSLKPIMSLLKGIKQFVNTTRNNILSHHSKSKDLLKQSLDNAHKLSKEKMVSAGGIQVEALRQELRRVKEEEKFSMQQISEKLFKLQNENDDLKEEVERKSEELIKIQAAGGTSQAKKERIDELERRLIDSLKKIESLNSELYAKRLMFERNQQKNEANSKEHEEMRKLLEEKEIQYNTLVIVNNNLQNKYNNKLEEEKIILEKFKTLITTNISTIMKNYNLITSRLETKLLGLTKVAFKVDHLSGSLQILVITNYLREHIDDLLAAKHKEILSAFALSLEKVLKARSRILSKTRRLAQSSLGQTSFDEMKEVDKSAFTQSSNALQHALINKNAKLTKELNKQIQVNNELAEKIRVFQVMFENREDSKLPTGSPAQLTSIPVSMKAVDDGGSPQNTLSPVGGRKDSVISVKTCPVLSTRLKEGEEDSSVSKHIKMLAIQCLEKVPINAIKEFDKLVLPLCSMLGMTQEEQKKLYLKRKEMKLDTQKKGTGGIMSLFG